MGGKDERETDPPASSGRTRARPRRPDMQIYVAKPRSKVAKKTEDEVDKDKDRVGPKPPLKEKVPKLPSKSLLKERNSSPLPPASSSQSSCQVSSGKCQYSPLSSKDSSDSKVTSPSPSKCERNKIKEVPSFVPVEPPKLPPKVRTAPSPTAAETKAQVLACLEENSSLKPVSSSLSDQSHILACLNVKNGPSNSSDILNDSMGSSSSESFNILSEESSPSQNISSPSQIDTICDNLSPAPEIAPNKNLLPHSEEDSWDALFDETGECLKPELLKELTESVGQVKITLPTQDYLEFKPKDPIITEEEFGHIVELYDFSPSFKTQDLNSILNSHRNYDFSIKWVDDTHALAICPDATTALDLLQLQHPLMKLRPLSHASSESKRKAKKCQEFVHPYKPRPETSASIARRMVSGALGLKVSIPREQRELERRKLAEAKEKRRQANKKKHDAWEGVLS